MHFVIEMTPEQSEACDRFLKDNPGHCDLAREQDNFINEVKKLEEPTYITHPDCQRNLKYVMNPYADGDGAWLGLPGKTIPMPPQVYLGIIKSQPNQDYQSPPGQYNNAWPGHCFSQIQPQQIPPETSGNVSLNYLRKIGYVLFCFGNTENLGEILEVLDKLFPTPHFTTGEIGVYRSLQNANILYLVIPPGRNDLTQQLINTSISLKGQTRENGEKWPLIARLHNPDLTQMTIPLN